MKDIKAVEVVLTRMAELLRLGGFDDWAGALETCHSELPQDPSGTAARILSMYGGMGSLNDLILYKDGNVLVKEAEELDGLRSRLYELCHT
jgi:hypothetical protein